MVCKQQKACRIKSKKLSQGRKAHIRMLQQNLQNSTESTKSKSSQGGLTNSPHQSHLSKTKFAQTCPISGLEVHTDWITVLGNIPKIQPLIDYLGHFHQEKYELSVIAHKIGKFTYTKLVKFPSGIEIKYCFIEEDKSYNYYCNLRGRFMSSLSSIEQVRLIRTLSLAYNARCTRFDIAIDDYQRGISYTQIKTAVKSGNVVHCRDYKFIRSGKVNSSQVADTWYFGSKRKLIRFYNAEVVHGIPADRWEVQFREQYANQIFSQLASPNQEFYDFDIENSESAFCQVLTTYLVWSVDFVKKKDKNLKRCPRLRWWQKFVNRLSQGEVGFIKKYKPTFADRVDWLYRQVSKTLAILEIGLECTNFYELIDNLVSEGKRKLNSYDKALINEVKYLKSLNLKPS